MAYFILQKQEVSLTQHTVMGSDELIIIHSSLQDWRIIALNIFYINLFLKKFHRLHKPNSFVIYSLAGKNKGL